MMPRIDIHGRTIANRRSDIRHWAIASEEKRSLIRFLDELELGKVNRGRKISESRQCKYLDVLRTPLEFLKKTARKFTLKDIEAFERALTSGSLQSKRDQPYSHATKVDMRRALKIYLRWRLGKSAALPTGWPRRLPESQIKSSSRK